MLDRADSWWGVEAGVGKLPAPKRFVYLPDPGEQGLATGIISNQYDITTGIQPATFPTVFDGNDKVTTWTGQESPFGNIDWWPHSLYLNNEVAPWSDPNVRWAISYYLDREQIIDIGWIGRQSPLHPLRARLPGPASRSWRRSAADRAVSRTWSTTRRRATPCLTAKGWTKDGDGMWHDETGAAGRRSRSSASSTSPASARSSSSS